MDFFQKLLQPVTFKLAEYMIHFEILIIFDLTKINC